MYQCALYLNINNDYIFRRMKMDSKDKININEYDNYLYLGPISMAGYYRICKAIEENQSKENAMLCLSTFGGDPDAGFRIGRALQHHYNGNVTIYIPSVCKSAGTLTVISAKQIIMHNQGELGPLDIQLRKDNEIGVSNSGLDIFKTLDTLEDRANFAFNKYLRSVRFGQGLSTRMSAEIATQLVNAIIKPIAEQIDPMKIGEHQRATDIAIEYGKRLNQTSKCLMDDINSLNKLIREYPSHGFVIDRKEAKTIFSCVTAATEDTIKKFSIVHEVLRNSLDVVAQGLYVEFIQEGANDGIPSDIDDETSSTSSEYGESERETTKDVSGSPRKSGRQTKTATSKELPTAD